MFQWADNTSSAAIKAYQQGGEEDDRMLSYIRRWKTMSVSELKVVLKRKKLKVSGKKSILLERLKDAFRVQGDQVDQALGLQSYKNDRGGADAEHDDDDLLMIGGSTTNLTHMQQAERVLTQVFKFDYFRP